MTLLATQLLEVPTIVVFQGNGGYAAEASDMGNFLDWGQGPFRYLPRLVPQVGQIQTTVSEAVSRRCPLLKVVFLNWDASS